ncbi:MAG TPA: DEAD/DEAH box helicase [Candidatus Saccharimonadales bacterium]|nr:DEAD/DEAH box helicase [Candidatus Saccharimonadales bacterium]
MPYNSRTASRKFSARTAFHSGGSSRRSSGRSKGPRKDYIHPSRFVKTAKPVAPEAAYEAKNQFTDFGMDPILLANLARKGFIQPSPIQDEAIPHGMAGRDVIGLANTGTGKTVAFAIPALHRLLSHPGSKVLVIAPTRELAQQIEEEFKTVAKGTGMYGALLIGGANMNPQLRDLRSKPQIVIGTPGRIGDHLERGTLDLSDFDTVVLDEVDRMLDMGFVEDVTDILGKLAPVRQSFFFSATLDRKVRELIDFFANDPVTVSVTNGETTENVHQDIVCYETASGKIDQLHSILNKPEVTKAIIFDDTQRAVERLSKELQSRGFKADDIHGGKTQGQRQRALNRFKKDEVKILVATDVAARGIDVKDISHVINYSTPQTYDTYVHRIGRAGRAGAIGYALTFVTDERGDSRY